MGALLIRLDLRERLLVYSIQFNFFIYQLSLYDPDNGFSHYSAMTLTLKYETDKPTGEKICFGQVISDGWTD